jgi:hypothetical protein
MGDVIIVAFTIKPGEDAVSHPRGPTALLSAREVDLYHRGYFVFTDDGHYRFSILVEPCYLQNTDRWNFGACAVAPVAGAMDYLFVFQHIEQIDKILPVGRIETEFPGDLTSSDRRALLLDKLKNGLLGGEFARLAGARH